MLQCHYIWPGTVTCLVFVCCLRSNRSTCLAYFVQLRSSVLVQNKLNQDNKVWSNLIDLIWSINENHSQQSSQTKTNQPSCFLKKKIWLSLTSSSKNCAFATFICFFFWFIEDAEMERRERAAHKQMPTVSLWLFTELCGSRQSGLAAAAAAAASVLSGTHTHTQSVLLKSPDSLMLLCEFSSPLFLDPALAERGEERREGNREREWERGLGKTGKPATMPR